MIVSTRSRITRQRGAWTLRLAFLAVFAGLLAMSAWNLTRSSGLEDATRAYRLGDLETSLARALDHLDRRPWSRDAALLVARCYSRMDRSEQAEPYYTRAGRLELSDLQLRAYALARGPRPGQAVSAFNQILALAPDNLAAMRRLAAVELALDDKPALRALADRLEHTPGGAILGATLRGVLHHNEKNRELACQDFAKVLALDPELKEMPLPRVLFFSQYADDLAATGQLESARALLLKEVESHPDAMLWNAIGNTYLLQGKLEEAERPFKRALELNPASSGPLINLAKLELQRHKPELALGYLDRAKAIAPASYSVLYNLAVAYRQLGREKDANLVQETIKTLREDAPSDPLTTTWPAYAL